MAIEMENGKLASGRQDGAGRAGTDRAVVVTCDSHAGPLPSQLREYCPKRYLDDFDEFYNRPTPDVLAGLAPPEDWTPEQVLQTAMRNSLTEGGWDPHARLRDMNYDGIAGEVIFHGLNQGRHIHLLPWGELISGIPDPATPLELVSVGRRIYNQWLADFCSVEHERRAGLAHLPMWDPNAALKELEWAAEAGLRGVNFPRVQPGIPAYNHPDWEPFWSACEDFGMPLTTHAQGIPTGPGADSGLISTLDSVGAPARVAMHYLIFSGVFERHPNLRLVFTEQTDKWWTATKVYLDEIFLGIRSYQYDRRTGEDLPPTEKRYGDLSKLPSEYVAEQVFIGATCLAPFEAADACAEGYASQVLWGSDYPHIEGSFQYPRSADEEPMSKLALRDALAGVDRDSAALMAGENAARIYGLDIDKLRGVADRIGALTFDELAEPYTGEPDPPYLRGAFLCFRRHGSWH